MVSAAARTCSKPLLDVSRGAASGTVELAASVRLLMGGRNRRNKVFHWQWTADGGKTFNDTSSTPSAKTSIASLTPLTTIGFRVKVTTTTSPGEWSPIVSILVH